MDTIYRGRGCSLIPSPWRERVRVRVNLARPPSSNRSPSRGKKRMRIVNGHEIKKETTLEMDLG
jgi:hypothetical protein